MKILFVADGRSPIAMNWIAYFIERNDEVHLVTTFDCAPKLVFTSLTFIPVAFSQAKKRPDGYKDDRQRGLVWSSSLVRLRTSVRRILFPLTIPPAADKLRKLITDIQPDLVHAMRIPFEGFLASRAMESLTNLPLIISVWGNDLTLHGGANPWMKRHTERTLARADGLHTDCRRDLKLAHQWGYRENDPQLEVPGNGGIQTDVFYPPVKGSSTRGYSVINPRGVRSYIRNDTFFSAIPHVLDRLPQTKFICLGMAGQPEAQQWVDKFDIKTEVDLLPNVPRKEMAELFRSAAISVSPSTHDGTPNTLLEAMACGCYPVAGDLESVREWIQPGINGSLIDPNNPRDLAEAVIDALMNPELRQVAADINRKIIMEKAEYQASMQRAMEFYKTFL